MNEVGLYVLLLNNFWHIQWKVRYRPCIQHNPICIFNGYISMIAYPTSGINTELLTITVSRKKAWKSRVRGRMDFHCINFCTAWIFIMSTYCLFHFKKINRNEKQINSHLLNINWMQITLLGTQLHSHGVAACLALHWMRQVWKS